ncbi:MAG TPA: AAA family ATPase [Solirubrobacteraceae bacterium]|nr:AAA family ATPase [Solirubrobacteraceae bacterium]
MAVQITLLGAPSVTRDGTPVALDTRKALALIAHLVLADRARSREAVCALLWPDQDASHARGALRRTLSTVRSAIGEQWILALADSVALRRGPGLEIDVDRFRRLARDDASTPDLAAAAAVFGGDLLEGFALRGNVEFDDWCRSQADDLRRELSAVLMRLVAGLTARGSYEQALLHARRWLSVDALHEPAHRELIRLYALTGDRAAALEQYRDCVRTLSRELGVAPLRETADLYEQINDGRLTAGPRRPPSPHAEGAAQLPAELPLVGRDRERAALLDAHAASAPDGRLAVIEGEAGIGKTRLFEELSRSARADGAVVLAARCHDDEAGLPYGPIIELLRAAHLCEHNGERPWTDAVAPQRLADAALLLPELAALRAGTPAPPPLDGPGARVRLLEAIGAVVGAACAGPTPGIVFLDDVHGADEATIDAIAHLGRRLAGRPLLLVVSWRSEAVQPGHRLRRLTADVTRAGAATIVSPVRLTRDEVAALVQAGHPGAPAPELEQRVYLESEGLPLFVAQYLAAHGASSGAPPSPNDPMPVDIQGFLTARLDALGAVSRQVLGAAAAIGRSFDLATVRDASGRGEDELISALDELLAQDVVREVGGSEPSYDFSHEKLRSLVYRETSMARRRLLHRRIAAALLRRPGADERAALVAKHLRLAGEDAAAAAQYRVAAEHAAALHANDDALHHLDAALALGDPDATGAHERIGDLRTLLGDYAGALVAYDTAAAHAEPPHRPAIELKLGNVHHRRGEWSRAEACFATALEGSGAGTVLRARVLSDLGHTLRQSGDSARGAQLAADALRIATAAGDPRAEAQAHNLLGVLAHDGGDVLGATAQLERSLELARELGDPAAQAAALNNLALVQREAGALHRARELTEQALALCVVHGDRHREAALENNLADIDHAAGAEGASMHHLKRAVAIFAEVGADEATRLPEIWKLVSW